MNGSDFMSVIEFIEERFGRGAAWFAAVVVALAPIGAMVAIYCYTR